MRVLVRVFVCVCVFLLIAMHSLWGGGLFPYFWSHKENTHVLLLLPPFILRVNHATDYRSYCASRISHRPKDAFNAFGRISSPKPLEFCKETNTWEKRQRKKKSIHLNELFFPRHTQRCNIFTNMYTDKYKKLFRLMRIIIIIPRFPSLLFLIFCTIIALWMNGTEHCSLLFFPYDADHFLPHLKGAMAYSCGEA